MIKKTIATVQQVTAFIVAIGGLLTFSSCQKVEENVALNITDSELFFKIQEEQSFGQFQALGYSNFSVAQSGNRLEISISGNLIKQASVENRSGRYLRSQSGERFLVTGVNADPLAEIGTLN